MAKLSWRTCVWLAQVAETLEDAGLPFWAKAARDLSKEHGMAFEGCDEDTCPTVPRGRTQELWRMSEAKAKLSAELDVEGMLRDDDSTPTE